MTYVFIMVECIEHVIGKAREKVNDKPRLEVIHTNDFRLGDDFAPRTHKGCMEVENNVNEKDYVHDGVNDEKTYVLRRLVLEGNIVGHHYSCVES